MQNKSKIVLHPPKRVGHLSVITEVLRSSGILEMIDSICGVDQRMKVSHGDCVEFILLGVFAGEHGLWRLTERLDPYDLATIVGDDGVNVHEFHDVRLGRALDAIYHAGVERLQSAIALKMIAWATLDLSTLHFDTTSLSFYGAYEEDLDDTWAPEMESILKTSALARHAPKRNDVPDGDGRESPLVVHGYAKNHRFDLKQILFGMVVAGDGGVPLYGRAMNGNTADVTAACEFLDHLRTQLPDPRAQCLVADSKGWAAATLEQVRLHRLRLLSRLPRSTSLAQQVVREFVADDAPCLLRHYHGDRRRWSWVAYAGSDAHYTFYVDEPLLDGQGKPVLDDAGIPRMQRVSRVIPVRVVSCFSSELYRQKAETLGAIAQREGLRAVKLLARLARRTYACAADAQQELDALCQEQPFVTLEISGRVGQREIPRRRARRGRPRADEAAPEPDIRFALNVHTTPASPAANAARLRRAATYVLVRNRMDDWQLDDHEMITRYSHQWRCEHGFSWLKSEAAINPMFLESPRRIQALCFLYTLALMVHTIIQRNVRKYLVANKLALPYHRNKPSDKITARFFYELYRNVTTQIVQIDGHREKRIYGMDEWTTCGLKALGASPRAYRPVIERPRENSGLP